MGGDLERLMVGHRNKLKLLELHVDLVIGLWGTFVCHLEEPIHLNEEIGGVFNHS